MTTARILLVEDDPVSREVIAALLASRGHEVDAVDDGFSALRLAQEKTYDLVLLDYHLPEMDGYTLARLIRSLSDASQGKLQVVAITADQSGLSARPDAASIFNHVLTKPIEPDVLFTSIDNFLGGSPVLGELEDFVATTQRAEEQSGSGQTLWRVRGLAARPRAIVFPFPTAAERENLEHCFQIVDRDADCIILLRQAGLPAVGAFRTGDTPSFEPLFVLDSTLSPIADVYFRVGDGDSWTAAARAITSFAARSARLNPIMAETTELDLRLAAYLFVADRALVLSRDALGQTIVSYTGGFPAAAVVDVIKRLSSRGLVTARLDASVAGYDRRLVVSLSSKGLYVVAQAEKALCAS